MTAHELVIRLGRPFDVRLGNGAFLADVREIMIPFADRESAELALREVQSFVRPVHDAGGEDYRPAVAGLVLRADSAGDCLCLPPERESRALTSACPVHSAPTATGKPLLLRELEGQ